MALPNAEVGPFYTRASQNDLNMPPSRSLLVTVSWLCSFQRKSVPVPRQDGIEELPLMS